MQPVDRLHALDAVRAYALLLGVVLHASAAFLEDFPIPMWQDVPNDVPAVMYYVIHMFRMSAFFLMAGLFARMVLERRGTKAFARDRLKRVAVPLFLFGPVVLAMILVGFVLGALPHGTQYLASLAQQPPAAAPESASPGGGVNLAHLWFLYYLLIFYALALLLRAGVGAVDPRGAIAAACDRVVAFVMRGVWAPVSIALPIAVYLWQLESWTEWLGLPAPFSIVPQITPLIGYGIPFALGWLLHRQLQLLLDLRKTWLVHLVAALALTGACLAIIGVKPLWEGPNLAGSDRVLYTAAYTVGLWCWVLAFVGAAVRFLSEPSPATRYLADASYWVYLMHMAAIIFFITLLRPYDWHWSLKLAIILGGSLPILLLSYHYLVRFSWIGAILNGRRHRRVGKSPPGDAAPVSP
jgi:glucans biosynthesis protein C